MAEAVYVLCTLTSVLCALLLLRSYRKARTTLLMWSTACFGILALNNVLLVIDLMVVPDLDLTLFRSGSALGALVLLLIGLTWEDS